MAEYQLKRIPITGKMGMGLKFQHKRSVLTWNLWWKVFPTSLKYGHQSISSAAIDQRPLSSLPPIFFSFFKRFYLFLERLEGREKERERNINVWLPLMCPLLGTWPATQACALTWNRTSIPLVHRTMLNPLSYTSHAPTHFLAIVAMANTFYQFSAYNYCKPPQSKSADCTTHLWSFCFFVS